MKKLKKLVGFVLALAMVLGLSTTVFADENTTKITMSDTTSEYEAYQLMTVTVSGTNYSYTVNDKYSSILIDVLSLDSTATSADIVTEISGLDTDEMSAFADTVYEEIENASLSADYTATSGVFTVPYGYYLIAETALGASETRSLVMVDTAASETLSVSTKEDTPEMTKKVIDVNDSTGDTSDYQDTADYDIGDEVPFQLTGTVDENIAEYDTYYYAFHDVMSDGLTFNSSSVVVKIDGTTIDSTCYTVKTSLTDGCSFEIIFTDLKACTEDGSIVTLTADSKVTVDFTATLNEKAVIGNPGNVNTAFLEYSNNPYDQGDGNTSETPWDTVVVFTYEVIINKVDKSGNSLTGAAFTLYKYDYATKDWKTVKAYTLDDTTTTFNFTGLDDGTYKLVETSVPAGYNKIDDIDFTITAVHSDNVTPVAGSALSTISNYLTSLSTDGTNITFTASIDDGSLTADVVNQTGSVLPSTGGIGTTIFYIIGGIIVVGVAVILITRRRMRRV